MPEQACAKRIKKMKNTATAIKIKTFKIMPKTLIPFPLPTLFAFDTPTMHRVRETSAVIVAKINSVDAFSVIMRTMLTAIFKIVSRNPIVALAFDLFSLLTFLFTLSLFIL